MAMRRVGALLLLLLSGSEPCQGLAPKPPVLSSCPSTVGDGKLEIKACGGASCRASQRVPEGVMFEICDLCSGTMAGVWAQIEGSGSDRYTVTIKEGGSSSTGTVQCGTCVTLPGDNYAEISCSGSSGLAAGAIVGIVIGVLVLVGVIGGAVWWYAKKSKKGYVQA